MNPLETPYAYDFWVGCNVLSAALGRDIIVNRPMAPVYLNLFTILVAESGITRKSTAVRHGLDFIRKLEKEDLALIEGKTTPERLEEILYEQTRDYKSSNVSICISELVTFLGREKYVSTMPTLLTDLYDSPKIRRLGGSLKTGSREAHNVFVQFLSASTPSWLVRAVNPDVIEGGFTSRVMFICAENPKKRQSWPEAPNKELEQQILIQLNNIKTKAKEVEKIELNLNARKVFDRWYKSRTLHKDPFRASFQSREDAHTLRLAAFLAINDGTWVIHSNHITQAIKIINEVREDGAQIFEGTGTNSRLIAGIDKIRDKLLEAGINGLPQTNLTKAVSSYMDAEHLVTALNIMHELQFVQKFDAIQVG
ncbi:MAG: DUF3987 domain-containing protein, partial [Microcystis sp. M31BS1]